MFAGMDQPGIGDQPPEQILELLVALDRLGELLAGVGPAGERGELALEVLLEGDRLAVGAIEIALHRGIVNPGIEVAEIPFRQLAEALEARLDGFAGAARADRAGIGARSLGSWNSSSRQRAPMANMTACDKSSVIKPTISGARIARSTTMPHPFGADAQWPRAWRFIRRTTLA